MGNPIETIRDFLTGGEEFTRRRERLHDLNQQRHNRRLSQREAQEYEGLNFSVGRRLLLAQTSVSLVTVATVGGIGLSNLGRLLRAIHGADPSPVLADTNNLGVPNNPDSQPVSTERASGIRQQIRQFEAENADKPVTKETIGQLYQMVSKLYEVTFGKSVKQTTLELQDTSKDRVTFKPSIGWRNKDNTLTIVLGKQDIKDSDLSLVSVYKGLLMRGVFYPQLEPVQKTKRVDIGGEQFLSSSTVGLRWVLPNGNQRASFFDEANVQLLGGYLNDPSGKDDLFDRISRSSLYSSSLSPVYVEAGKLLKQIYQRLGISPEEIEAYHYNSQPEELLSRLDHSFVPQRAGRLFPISYTLMRLNPSFPGSAADLAPLRGIVAQLPQIN